MQDQEEPIEGPKRVWGLKNRLLIWLNTIVAIGLLLGILVAVNYISRKYHKRLDITSEKLYEISDETINLLKNLDRAVTVYIAAVEEGYIEALSHAWRRVRDLLDTYRSYAPQYIRLQEVSERDVAFFASKKLDVKINDIVFVCGDKSRSVNILETYLPGERGTGRISEFSAEEKFTSAIKYVLREKKDVIYFETGHGDIKFRSMDKDGLNYLVDYLENNEHCETREINLKTVSEVPQECNVLFVIGPQRVYAEEELRKLDAYLKRGGSIFLFLDVFYENGMDKFLKDWGIKYERKVVMDRRYSPPDIVPIKIKSSYPEINKKSRGLTLWFHASGVVEGIPEVERKTQYQVMLYNIVEGEELFGIAELDYFGKRIVPDESRGDIIKREISLAVTMNVTLKEKDEKEGDKKGIEIEDEGPKKKGRMVVIGTPRFIRNEFTRGTTYIFTAQGLRPHYYPSDNLYYTVNCLRWLLEREKELSIPPKKYDLTFLNIKKRDVRRIFWYSIAGIPSIGIILGLLVWFLRRK
jgi:hypothetical protein